MDGAPRTLLRLAPALVALASGVLWGLAQGYDTWPLASWVVLAPFLALVDRPRPVLLGFLHGLATWLVAIPWIAPTLTTFGDLPPALAMVLWGVLASYLALFHAAFAGLAAPLWRRREDKGRWRAVLLPMAATPALWVALEWLRTYLLSGFPWNLAGYAWERVPGALPLAAWIGAYGISFLLLFANCGVALAARPGQGGGRWIPVAPLAIGLLIPLALLPMGGRWGSGIDAEEGEYVDLAALTDLQGGRLAAARPVALVQPNIPNRMEPDWPTIARDYRRLIRLSEAACAAPGTLVVWPESAGWPYDFFRDGSFRDDLRSLAAAGCPVLFNTVAPAEGGGDAAYNSAVLLTPEGGLSRYDKRHLVPFGEYVPLSGVFFFLDKLARRAGRLTAADEVRLLPWGDERLAVEICFEVVFPGEVAAAVRAGATVLVSISNDAWYGDSAAPRQHFRAARFRAAESRRPLLRAAITGISGLVAPDGAVRARLDVGAEGVLRGRVRGRSDLSPYTRAPWLVPALCSLVGVGGWVLVRFFPGRAGSQNSGPDPSQALA